MKYKTLFKIQTICICIIPFALITGPFFPDLLAVLSSVLFIYILFKKKEFDFILNKYVFIYFFWVSSLIVLSLLSLEPIFSLNSSLFYFRFGLFALSIAYLLKHTKFLEKNLFYSILITIILLVIDSFLQYIFGKNVLGFEFENRISSFFGEEQKLGSFLLRISPILFFLIIKNKYITNLYVNLIILASIVFVIILTGERTAIFLLVIYFIIIFFSNINFSKFFLILSFAVSLIFLIFLSLNLNTLSRVKSAIDYSFDPTVGDIDNFKYKIISSQYTAHFLTAYNIFKHNQLIGVGPKMFRVMCDDDRYEVIYGSNYLDPKLKNFKVYNGCSTHPHSTYLQLMSETGIIGTIPVLILFLTFSFIILRNIYLKFYITFINKNLFYNKLEFHNTVIISLLLVNIFPFTTSGNFFNNWLSVIYYLPLGFLYNEYLNKTLKI